MMSQWIVTNKKVSETIKRVLLEKDMENSNSDIPLMSIYRLINGAEAEITRLQNEINNQERQIKELKKLVPTPEESPQSDK